MFHVRSRFLAPLLLAAVAAGAVGAVESAATATPPPVAPAPAAISATPKLPPQAQAEFERLVKAIDKLKEDYATKAIAELEKGRQALKKAQAAATRAGDADGAQAIQARLAELDSTALLRVGADDDNDTFAPQDPILGAWTSGGYEYEFRKGGVLVLYRHSPQPEKGTWKPLAANTYQLIWPWGNDRVVIDTAREGKDFWPDGTPHAFTRIK